MKKSDRSELGRAMQALRKTHSGGRKPRTVMHDPEAKYCLCIDCRTARGHYPNKPRPKPAKPSKHA